MHGGHRENRTWANTPTPPLWRICPPRQRSSAVVHPDRQDRPCGPSRNVKTSRPAGCRRGQVLFIDACQRRWLVDRTGANSPTRQARRLLTPTTPGAARRAPASRPMCQALRNVAPDKAVQSCGAQRGAHPGHGGAAHNKKAAKRRGRWRLGEQHQRKQAGPRRG